MFTAKTVIRNELLSHANVKDCPAISLSVPVEILWVFIIDKPAELMMSCSAVWHTKWRRLRWGEINRFPSLLGQTIELFTSWYDEFSSEWFWCVAYRLPTKYRFVVTRADRDAISSCCSASCSSSKLFISKAENEKTNFNYAVNYIIALLKPK